MAAAKTRTKKKQRGGKIPVRLIFWILFIIVITFIFIIKIPKMKQTLENTRFFDRVFNRPAEKTEQKVPPGTGGIPPESGDGEAGQPLPPLEWPPQAQPVLPFDPATPFGTDNPADLQQPPPVPVRPDTPQESVRAVRERTLYFVTVDGSGMVFLSPVKRSLPAVEAPLVEVLNSLLAGPSAEEIKAGFQTLIPADAKLIGARIDGNTAYLNFNERFQYNALDAEGYYAQLRQIVWTVTEFPNVRNVQILVDNRRVEFLGLTIRIDKPLGRESL
ncbi:MAG: GerMN domain-containing protein [Spirochaetaceae bacterium]|jgi:hypothetical protein|nr:GerMN domain-containing protein [Spirochaetaceae bacterium]